MNNSSSTFNSLAIVIPTWNNLPYLKLCIESIRKNSTCKNEIVVHVNEGTDGTKEFLIANQIPFTHSDTNIGICRALNQAVAISHSPLICYLNDDMYCLPNWDAVLLEKVKSLDTNLFMISATMIEPKGKNPCCSIKDFGDSIETFREGDLLQNFKDLQIPDWYGSCWPPNIMHREIWNKVGGMSEEFSPGMSSDNDLAMKFWMAGCRIFLGLGNSMVYHFQCKSTGRVQRNPGSKQFLHKWKISSSFFDRYYLRRGQRAMTTVLPKPQKSMRYFYDFARGYGKRIARNLFGSHSNT